MPKVDTEKIKRSVQALEEPFKEALLGFKPRFGNQEDIEFIERLGKIEKMERELAAKLAAAKGGQTLSLELIREKKGVIEYFKNKRDEKAGEKIETSAGPF